jgi:betaine-aldehyde dehydrogenase
MKLDQPHFIDGKWQAGEGQARLPVHNASTEALMAELVSASLTQTEQAIVAARRAFETWSQTPVQTRCEMIDRVVQGLKDRTDELGETIANEVGMPLKLAKMIQVGGPVFNWSYTAKVARSYEWEQTVGNSQVLREPIGVVSCITPWNFPLNQITLKVAPALAAGCTVVLKPSEIAPLNAIILAEIIEAAGFPPGVFNLIHGTGPEVGELMVSHPAVDMVSFTGSTRAGRRIGELAAQTIKRVALELGGKSASVVLPDADLEAAVKGTVSACMLNSGQTCSAHTRLLVHESQYEAAKPLIAQAIQKLNIGPSLDETSRLGPLVSANQRDRVVAMIEKGLAEGAELIVGGPERPDLPKGYFVQPTAMRVQPQHTLAREEIFGPVLVVLTYKDEDDAIRIANNTAYGLGGGVWSADETRAMAVARKLRTGQVDINGAPFNSKAPFGGYKQSGNGRENGVYGFEEFLEYKAVQFKPAAQA